MSRQKLVFVLVALAAVLGVFAGGCTSAAGIRQQHDDQLNSLDAQMRRTISRFDAVGDKLALVEEALAPLEGLIAQSDELAKVQKRLLAQVNSQVSALREQKKALDGTAATLDGKLKRINSAMAGLVGDIGTLRDSLRELGDSVIKEEDLAAVRAKLGDLEKAVAGLQGGGLPPREITTP